MIGGLAVAGSSCAQTRVVPSVVSLWAGALTDDGLTVVARLSRDASEMRLVVSDGVVTTASPLVSSTGGGARLTITGLSPGTAYTYQIEAYGSLVGPVCPFCTLPAPGAAEFTVAFSGDTDTGHNHVVFDTIRLSDPLMFIHLGDLHYEDIATNSQPAYHAAYDAVLAAPRQAQLYRDVPTTYVWDDHDFGPNN